MGPREPSGHPFTAQPSKKGVTVERGHPTTDDASSISPALNEDMGRMQGERWRDLKRRRQVEGDSLGGAQVGEAAGGLGDPAVQAGATP